MFCINRAKIKHGLDLSVFCFREQVRPYKSMTLTDDRVFCLSESLLLVDAIDISALAVETAVEALLC